MVRASGSIRARPRESSTTCWSSVRTSVLREVRQVLTEENFAKVRPGMSSDEVRYLLGRPAHELYFSLKQEKVWDWKTKVEPGMTWYFNVHFNNDGVVTRTSTNFTPGP
ncbi:MAG: outer membrane protein assembly factor BamE [Candidatus Accumulibacter delftensis]|jgi:outer membrane protein assembly factor BamE (lipoprotein component of BamABCDE complex)